MSTPIAYPKPTSFQVREPVVVVPTHANSIPMPCRWNIRYQHNTWFWATISDSPKFTNKILHAYKSRRFPSSFVNTVALYGLPPKVVQARFVTPLRRLEFSQPTACHGDHQSCCLNSIQPQPRRYPQLMYSSCDPWTRQQHWRSSWWTRVNPWISDSQNEQLHVELYSAVELSGW